MEPVSNPPAGTPPVIPDGSASAPPPPVTPPPQNPPPVYQAGGKTGVAKFFDGVTLVDVLAGAMFFGALALGIYYYRKKIKFMQSDQKALIDKVEELEDEVESIKNPVVAGY